jgi:two-component system response regulator YesN
MVTAIIKDEAARKVTVRIEYDKEETLACPVCGQSARLYDHRIRTLQYLDTCQYETFLEVHVPQVKCKEDGVQQTSIPFAKKHPISQFTNLFFEIAINNFSLRPLTIENINNAFKVVMQCGIFRVCFIRFDFFHHTTQDKAVILAKQEECLKIIRKNIQKICYDLLLASNYLQCRMMINYPPETEDQVRRTLESCLIEIKRFSGVANTADVTFGVSLPYEDLSNTRQAIIEAMEAIWLRFSKGAGKVIYWEKDQALPSKYVRTLENYKHELKKACELLDINAFHRIIKEFFSLPGRILMCKETRRLVYEVEHYMYEINREYISMFSDVALVQQAIREAQRQARTLKEYLDSYTTNMTSLFKEIIERCPKGSKLVRLAQYFVDQNIGKIISLTDVADQIGLNSVYFSYLFKKTTGGNFTDYVIARKIITAKAYLTARKEKIGTIAILTGFSNAKYFSRTFKRIEGVTPSEYRKLHGVLPIPRTAPQ